MKLISLSFLIWDNELEGGMGQALVGVDAFL
jgi:hypothetical protein